MHVQAIYDLLVPNSADLPLREDPVLGAVPAGLTRATVASARDILSLLEAGNARRKTERTDANTSSSRSHAVLEVRRAHTCMPCMHVRGACMCARPCIPPSPAGAPAEATAKSL
jgi:hypothetical protein